MKYKFGGRDKLLALGEWPHTSLKRARERRDEIRRLLADGIDPAAKKKAERAAIADTFSALAREYLDTKRSSFNPKTLSKLSMSARLLFVSSQLVTFSRCADESRRSDNMRPRIVPGL